MTLTLTEREADLQATLARSQLYVGLKDQVRELRGERYDDDLTVRENLSQHRREET